MQFDIDIELQVNSRGLRLPRPKGLAMTRDNEFYPMLLSFWIMTPVF